MGEVTFIFLRQPFADNLAVGHHADQPVVLSNRNGFLSSGPNGHSLWGASRGPHSKRGGARMRRLLSDIVLFSCLAAFVAGLVIAAATLLI